MRAGQLIAFAVESAVIWSAVWSRLISGELRVKDA